MFAGFWRALSPKWGLWPHGKLDERPARAGLPSESDRRKRKL